MRLLLKTRSVSQAEGLRLALVAEDIPAVVGNTAMAPLQDLTVSVRDEDYERARAVLADFEHDDTA